MAMKTYYPTLLSLIFVLYAVHTHAQKIENLPVMKQQSQNELFHRLDKAPRTPAFECEGYWSWGSSVVKGEDGKYHMFVSRFPKSLPFHPGWMIASEIVHAVSDMPEGPYQFSGTWSTILGRTFHPQSAYPEVQGQILPYIYGVYPPIR